MTSRAIPDFQPSGLLPPGIFPAGWPEICLRFGGSERRVWLLQGLRKALDMLGNAGCGSVFLDGSFVTDKADPNDYDALWDARGVRGGLLDPVLLDFADRRLKQKLKYRGELFPVGALVDGAGIPFLDFFQLCKVSGNPKGIIQIELSVTP